MDQQSINYIVLAIPVFFLLIGIEVLISWIGGKGSYRFNDAITNISCGIGSQVMGVFIKVVTFVFLVWLHEKGFYLWEIPNAVWSWFVCLVLVDFAYYWFHRYSHEWAFMWGAHIVHHQSEEYNLSVALRQSAIQSVFSTAFYVPIILLGFDPLFFVGVNSIQTLYQFWIHTRHIKKMGPFGWLFNTPSHHRVHHGINPKYIDKNHGGTFIIWDRLFGTFQAEEEAVVYGTVKPLASWNPIWANLDYYVDLFKHSWKANRFIDKIKIWFMPPGWLPEDMGGPKQVPEITPEQQKKYDTPSDRALNAYVLFQYVVLLLGTTGFLMQADNLAWTPKLLAGGLVFLSILTLGILLEWKKWGFFLEIARLVILPLFLVYYLDNPTWLIPILAGGGGYLLVSVVWLAFKWKKFKEYSTQQPALAQA